MWKHLLPFLMLAGAVSAEDFPNYYGPLVTSTSLGLSGSVPGGSTTQVQFSDNGAFAGDPSLTYISSTGVLRVPTVSATNISATALTITRGDGNAASCITRAGTTFCDSMANSKLTKNVGSVFYQNTDATNGNTFFGSNAGSAGAVPSRTIFVSGTALTTSWTAINFSSSTVTPSVPLDVSGSVRVTGIGITCGSTISGSIRYVASALSIAVCNGTSWTLVTTGTTYVTSATN